MIGSVAIGRIEHRKDGDVIEDSITLMISACTCNDHWKEWLGIVKNLQEARAWKIIYSKYLQLDLTLEDSRDVESITAVKSL